MYEDPKSNNSYEGSFIVVSSGSWKSSVLTVPNISSAWNKLKLNLNLSDRQIRDVMKVMDKNNDGVVDEEDFWVSHV